MTTDPADADYDDTPPDPVHATLDGGWTLTAPEGTDKAVLDFVLQELKDNDALWIFEDATRIVAERFRRAVEPSQPTEPISRAAELFLGQLTAQMHDRETLDQFIYGGRKPADQEPVWFTSNPGGDSWAKRRFIDHGQPYHWRGEDLTAHLVPLDPAYEDLIHKWKRELLGNWTHDIPGTYGHVAVAGDGGLMHHHATYVDADGTVHTQNPCDPDAPHLLMLTAKWAAHPPARPGWTGSIAGPPRPIPIKPTPWQTLPKGVSDGNRTVIIEPGAENNPDARRLELRNGRWEDVGPAFPNGLAPAYRGRPAPLPWSSPLADPIADMKRAAEDTP